MKTRWRLCVGFSIRCSPWRRARFLHGPAAIHPRQAGRPAFGIGKKSKALCGTTPALTRPQRRQPQRRRCLPRSTWRAWPSVAFARCIWPMPRMRRRRRMPITARAEPSSPYRSTVPLFCCFLPSDPQGSMAGPRAAVGQESKSATHLRANWRSFIVPSDASF